MLGTVVGWNTAHDRHFIDLFTPAELDTFALNNRVLCHLADEPVPEEASRDR
jgi:hypothetical protein